MKKDKKVFVPLLERMEKLFNDKSIFHNQRVLLIGIRNDVLECLKALEQRKFKPVGSNNVWCVTLDDIKRFFGDDKE